MMTLQVNPQLSSSMCTTISSFEARPTSRCSLETRQSEFPHRLVASRPGLRGPHHIVFLKRLRSNQKGVVHLKEPAMYSCAFPFLSQLVETGSEARIQHCISMTQKLPFPTI